MRKYIFVVISLIVLGGVCTYIAKPKMLSDNQLEVYQTKHTVNILKEKDKKKALELEDEYFLYFYYDDCSYCQQFRSSLKTYLANPKIPVYFVDTVSNDIDLVYAEKETKGTSSSNWFIDGTPTIMHIKNGKIVHMASGADEAVREVSHV